MLWHQRFKQFGDLGIVYFQFGRIEYLKYVETFCLKSLINMFQVFTIRAVEFSINRLKAKVFQLILCGTSPRLRSALLEDFNTQCIASWIS